MEFQVSKLFLLLRAQSECPLYSYYVEMQHICDVLRKYKIFITTNIKESIQMDETKIICTSETFKLKKIAGLNINQNVSVCTLNKQTKIIPTLML